MVDDTLLEHENLDDEEWAITPKPDNLMPDSVARERASEEFRDQLQDDPPAICITHGDADGLTSAALITAMEGADTVVRPVSHQDAYRFPDAIQDIQHVGFGVAKLYVTDFSIDDVGTADVVGGLIEEEDSTPRIEWFDHHQWDDEVREALEGHGVDLHIDDGECAASLIEREIDHEFHDHVQDLVDVTKDIDLWIREDDRSPRLNIWAEIAEPAEYIDSVLEHGADHPDPVQERIDERLAELEELEGKALDRAEQHTVGDWNVAMTYIRDGRSSEIGNNLVEEQDDDHHIAVVQRPDAELGIYSHSNEEGFAQCHEVADVLGGGGHPTAAGCAVPVESFCELTEYWRTAGDSVREDILGAVREAVDMDAEEKAEWSAADVRDKISR